MVEILKHGNKKIIECTLCGAKLRYSKEDEKQETVQDTPTYSYFKSYVVCPDCGEKITIK